MTEFVDTHCHLNDEQFADDIAAVIERAAESFVTRIINMGDDIGSSALAVKLADEHKNLFAAVGIHPENAREFTSGDEAQFASWSQNKKVVAVGEIGLDFYWEKDAERQELQKKLFVRQLDMARQLNLPVCIHDRDAHGATLEILRREGKNLRGVLHCFSGSLEMAREVLRMGFFIGVDGPLTYKNAAKLPEIVAAVPRDMLLLETDAPYLAPVPKRGKRNEPSYLPLVAAKVAALWGVEDVGEIAVQTTENAEALYGKLRRTS